MLPTGRNNCVQEQMLPTGRHNWLQEHIDSDDTDDDPNYDPEMDENSDTENSEEEEEVATTSKKRPKVGYCKVPFWVFFKTNLYDRKTFF